MPLLLQIIKLILLLSKMLFLCVQVVYGLQSEEVFLGDGGGVRSPLPFRGKTLSQILKNGGLVGLH